VLGTTPFHLRPEVERISVMLIHGLLNSRLLSCRSPESARTFEPRDNV
jgi:hypothetical protein